MSTVRYEDIKRFYNSPKTNMSAIRTIDDTRRLSVEVSALSHQRVANDECRSVISRQWLQPLHTNDISSSKIFVQIKDEKEKKVKNQSKTSKMAPETEHEGRHHVWPYYIEMSQYMHTRITLYRESRQQTIDRPTHVCGCTCHVALFVHIYLLHIFFLLLLLALCVDVIWIDVVLCRTNSEQI